MRFFPVLAGSFFLVVGAPVFSAQATDPTPRRASARETAQAKSKHLPGQIIVDPDHPQWFKRAGDGPFFMCGPGDPEGFLYRGKLLPDGTRRGDQVKLIHKLAGTGANCIYLIAVRSHGGDGDPTQNPFIDHDPSRGLNPKVLDQWERWFAEMDRHQITIFFIFYDDSARLWNTGDKVGPQERKFLRTLVDRFKHHRNLIWCVAEEYQEALTPRRASRIAAEIRAADDYDHPIAIHKLPGLDFAEFADDPNLDEFAIQYNVNDRLALHKGILQAWKAARGRYNLNMSEAAKYGAGREARLKSWACAMAGAYVMILGMDIAHTPVEDLKDCGRLVQFFESTNFYEMAPHDELALAATEFVLARPGRSYILYTSRPGALGVKGIPHGLYRFRWFDCATGHTVLQRGVRVERKVLWTRPNGIGDEMALYVTRAE